MQDPDEITFKKLFYDIYADVTLRFADGQMLKFSKFHLCLFTKSNVLRQLFFGELSKVITEITDLSFEKFKLFLDCLIGITPYTEENSLEIFPVAWKYQVDESLDKIYKCLTPTRMNARICHTLNLAQLYQCKKLSDTILWDFLWMSKRYHILLEKEEYLFLLSVDSLKFLLHMMEDKLDESLDSYSVNFMIKWTENYVQHEQADILTFLKKSDLYDYIFKCKFESAGSVTRFFESQFGQDYFSGRDIANLLRKNLLLPRDSQWILKQPGESITETFIIHVPFYTGYVSRVNIKNGRIIFYDEPEEQDLDQTRCQIKMFFRNENGILLREFNKGYRFSPKYDFMIRLKMNETMAKIMECTIEWVFRFHCRILKVSHSKQLENEVLPLYFTKEPPKWVDLVPLEL